MGMGRGSGAFGDVPSSTNRGRSVICIIGMMPQAQYGNFVLICVCVMSRPNGPNVACTLGVFCIV